jgi:hypothetical protein
LAQKVEDWDFEQICVRDLLRLYGFPNSIDFGMEVSYIELKRAGRIQSADRAVPTSSFYNLTNLLSSLTHADSGQVTKGASYV